MHSPKTTGRDGYFESYGDPKIHSLMLQDNPRTEGYRDAILGNAEQIKGKVVMDIGAGTGILSLFAARAGAKKVYAIEASDTAYILRQIVKDNEMEDIIEVHHTKVEDLDIDEQVDVIISEWMGFYLLHESMLDSVIFARDKYLKPNGLLFPESAAIYMTIISHEERWKREFGWAYDSFHSFDFSAMIHPLLTQQSQPSIYKLPAKQCNVAAACELIRLDLHTITLEDLKVLEKTAFIPFLIDSIPVHGYAIWFDVSFPGGYVLSTSPDSPSTHWKQTVVWFETVQMSMKGIGLAVGVKLSQSYENKRNYIIEAEVLEPFNHSYGVGDDEEETIVGGSEKCVQQS